MATPGFPADILIQALNHVLSRESWARERLAPFSGKVAQITAPPFTILFSPVPDGTLISIGASEDLAAVSLSLPSDALAKVITGEFAAISSATKISGSAEFAEALSFVFKNLRWDIEGDLSDLIGEIPAWRSLQILRRGLAWQQKAALNLLENAKEYLVEESRQILSEREVRDFSQSVTELRDELARLEKRIARL